MEELRKVQIKNFIKKEFDIEIDDKYIEDYDEALTHYNDQRTGGTRDPERLAFLGDSYLDFLVAKYLFNQKKFSIGEMDYLKQQLVPNKTWQKIAKEIGLNNQIVFVVQGIGHTPQCFMSKIEDRTILARSFEALAGVLSYDCLDNAEEKLIALFIKLGYLQNLSKPDDPGRDEEALACYDKAIEINQKDATVWSLKSWVLDDLGRDEEASACRDKAQNLFRGL